MHQPPGVRTYKLRRSRITARQSAAIETQRGKWLLPATDTLPPKDWAQQYEGVVLEIGFGMGEGTLAYAALQPEVAVLAVDLHTPGIGNLLVQLAEAEVPNVRVVEADAVELLHSSIAAGALAGVRAFFPDPWPKARHHKRRLVNSSNLALMASRTVAGGFFHFATDWPDYAEAAREALAQSDEWQLLADGERGGWADPATRPQTKFEQRGIEAGRPITDLVAIRR